MPISFRNRPPNLTDFFLPSALSPKDQMAIHVFPLSKDLSVMTQGENESYQSANFRIWTMSSFSSWMEMTPHGFFVHILNQNDQYQFPHSGVVSPENLSPDKKALVISFRDDVNSACLSVIKTEDNIIGFQVLRLAEDRKQVTPYWLGRDDKENAGSQLLKKFFGDCEILFDKWSLRGKPIAKAEMSIYEITHPQISTTLEFHHE